MRRTWIAVTVVVSTLVAGGCTTVLRASVATDGTTADAGSAPLEPQAISDDGRYVAFASAASTLVPGDTNGVADVFRHDNRTGATERMSVDPAGNESAAASSVLSISGDGLHVVFATAAPLVADDTNGGTDVYVRSVASATTERVSILSSGAPLVPAGSARTIESATISDDGRFVLMNRTTFDTGELFLRDRVAGTTRHLTDASTPALSGFARTALLSGDGDHVVASEVCDRPLCAHTTAVLTVSTGAVEVVDASCAFDAADVGADGRYLVGRRFASLPGSSCPEPTGLVRWDRTTGRFRVVPITPPPVLWPRASIANSGRFVAAVADDGSVRVADLATGAVQRGDADALGTPGTGVATGAALSGNGRFVAFATPARVVPDDVDAFPDVFTRFAVQPSVTGLSPNGVARGTGAVTVVVTGTEILPGAVVSVSGSGVTVSGVTVLTPARATVEVSVEPGAPVGARDVTVRNQSGFGHSDGWCHACLTVT